MTLVLAIRSQSPLLNPEREGIRFEPGIALAMDSRFSYVNRQPPDDLAVKWWDLSEFSVAAYCGEVDLAEAVLASTLASCEYNKILDDPHWVRGAIRTIARKLSEKRRSIHPTTIVYAARENNNFSLYQFNSTKHFKPEKERDWCIIGSGATGIRARLVSELKSMAGQIAAPFRMGLKLPSEARNTLEIRRPSDTELVRLLDIGGRIGLIVDDVIAEQNISTVGGAPFILTLTHRGLVPVTGVKRSSSGEWVQFTAGDEYRRLMERDGKTRVGVLLDARHTVIDEIDVGLHATAPAINEPHVDNPADSSSTRA